LYKLLATLRTDVPLGLAAVDDLEWKGPRSEQLVDLCEAIGDKDGIERALKTMRERIAASAKPGWTRTE
jgi:hypothetical protein